MKFRKIITDPGVLFSFANIFAMLQSGSLASILITGSTAIASTTSSLVADNIKNNAENGTPLWRITKIAKKIGTTLPSFVSNQLSSPLRITAYGILAAGMVALGAGALLPGIAGLAFAGGNFMASSRWAQKIQNNDGTKGVLKALTHPAVYYGLGYAAIGLLAGGGLGLLASPLSNIPALITTSLGITATTMSSIGLLSGQFKNPAAPFMTVVIGTAFNVLAGMASGNILGALNNICALGGELRLAWIAQDGFEAKKAKQAQATPQAIINTMPVTDKGLQPKVQPALQPEFKNVEAVQLETKTTGLFRAAEKQLTRPLVAVRSMVAARNARPQPTLNL
jgi:hypothetical protein